MNWRSNAIAPKKIQNAPPQQPAARHPATGNQPYVATIQPQNLSNHFNLSYLSTLKTTLLSFKKMPKHLYLLRHAEAAPKEAQQGDKARELNQTGIKDSLHLGAWFLSQNIRFDLLASSTALRAEQTAGLIAESMKLDNALITAEDVLYEASVRQFLDYVNNIDDTCQHVLISGHNPSVSYLAEYLTKSDIGDMVPAGVAIIKFPFGSWKEVSENTGELVHYLTPEDVARF